MPASPAVPAHEIARRHRALRERLEGEGNACDAVLAVQKADLFWLAGTTQQAHLLLPAAGHARLLVRKVLERAREDSPLEDVRRLKSLRRLPNELRDACGPPPWRVGLELDVLPVSTWRRYEGILGDDAEIVDVSGALLEARARKSAWEVERLREAGALHGRLFAGAREVLGRRGISSYEVQARLDARARELGHCGVIRMRGLDVECAMGIVVSGEEGAVPGHSMFPIGGPGPCPWVAAGGSFRPIEDDTPVVLDYLMSLTGYHADCTRMAVRGRFPEEASALLEALRDVLRCCEERLRPGAVPARIWDEAKGIAEEKGLDDGFMGRGEGQVRFVGHGVGLEVNELPVLAPRFETPLEPGHVVAVEPKYTHPRFGVVGLENTYVITGTGAEKLTDAPEDVIVA